jgi:cyanophycinase-like exopeptidase
VTLPIGKHAGMLHVALACSITVFPRHGTYVPTARLHGPGLLLDGAGVTGSPPASIVWLHRRIIGSAQRGGNVVVLRASYSDVYDRPFVQYGNFASVQTVLIPPCAAAVQVDSVAPIVDKADAVYFAGGDQAHYVAWKGSALMEAVKRVYARGGGVGGGSAGLAIQGAVVYDSVAGDRLNQETATSDAVADPLEARISFTTGLFAWPPLAETLTDTHLVARNRFGRMVVFLARILHDGLLPGARAVYGLGIDQGSAVEVDPDGTATVRNFDGGRGAYLVRADAIPVVERGRPFRYTIAVSHVGRDGERFDLLHKQTLDAWYRVTIDAARAPIYSRDPYSL